MPVKPIVRYMLLCQDWQTDNANDRRINVTGLISSIRAVDEALYPLLYPEICVLLVLTEGRGRGEGKIVCVWDDSGETVFATSDRLIELGPDPLATTAVAFRIQECIFPNPGRYTVQFWYEGELVEERPLLLR